MSMWWWVRHIYRDIQQVASIRQIQCILIQPANKGTIKQSIHLENIFYREYIKEKNKAEFINKADLTIYQCLK